MDRWFIILVVLNVPCVMLGQLWFRRDQYYKTPQAQAVMDWLGRWLRWRASVPLYEDLRVIRRWTGITSLTIFCFILAWPHIAPARPHLPLWVLDTLLFFTFVWASLNAWIKRRRLIKETAKFVLLPPLIPWAMLALNRAALGQWSIAPFDSLIQHGGPLGVILAADNVWLIAAKISALYLPLGLLLALVGITLLSLVPLTYLAVVQPPVWIIRGWMRMTSTQKQNAMLVLYTASILMTAAITLAKVFMGQHAG